MIQIDLFRIHDLRDEEDFGFQSRVYNLGAALLTTDVDKTALAALKVGLDGLDEALEQSKKNKYTEDVAAADEKVDHLYTGLTLHVRAQTYHPVEATREAAEETIEIIDKYGVVADMPYNQEYGALKNSLQELNALPAETAEALGLNEWLAAIAQAVAVFEMTREQQTSEQSRYQVGLVKQMRTAADNAYRQFVSSINAYAIAFGEEGYAEFIGQVNVMIADIEAELKARKTRAKEKKKKKEEEEKAKEEASSTPSQGEEPEGAEANGNG